MARFVSAPDVRDPSELFGSPLNFLFIKPLLGESGSTRAMKPFNIKQLRRELREVRLGSRSESNARRDKIMTAPDPNSVSRQQVLKSTHKRL